MSTSVAFRLVFVASNEREIREIDTFRSQVCKLQISAGQISSISGQAPDVPQYIIQQICIRY